MTVVLAALTALALLFLVQPFVFQLSCAMAGVKPPPVARAAGITFAVFVLGTLASLIWGLSGGLVLSFVHGGLGVVSGLAVVALVTAVITSAVLRISLGAGARVAVVHHILGALLSGLVTAVVYAAVALFIGV